MYQYCLIIIASLISVIPALLMKKFFDNHAQWYLVIIAIVASVIGTLMYLLLYKNNDSSRIYCIIKFLSIIIITIGGYLFLQEKLTIKHIIGILLGIVSIVLLSQK